MSLITCLDMSVFPTLNLLLWKDLVLCPEVKLAPPHVALIADPCRKLVVIATEQLQESSDALSAGCSLAFYELMNATFPDRLFFPWGMLILFCFLQAFLC